MIDDQQPEARLVNNQLPEGLVEAADEESLPEGYVLSQNYPNPFNPETEIQFHLPKASHVVVRVYNILGQEIRRLAEGQYEAGDHRVGWDGKDHAGNPVSSGTYFYQLQAGPFSQVKTMILLR